MVMPENRLEKKIASGLFWTFAERVFAQGISFFVSILLARLLLPDEYGAVSMTMVFIALANVLVANGLGEALIRKKDSSETDFSTIFICALLFSVILYCIVFIAAPFISQFYGLDITALLRVLALKIPLAAINSIQHAYIAKHMIFKKMFWATSFGTVISGFVGVGAALSGAGAWALVAQYLTNSIIDTCVLLIVLPWRPQFVFDKSSAKEMIPYGWRIMISSLINTAFNEARSLVIGKVYTSADLAFYQKGNQIPALVINNVDTAIGKVVFPAMSSVNDDLVRLKEMARKFVRMSTFVIFPIMLGLFSTADRIIILLLTEKWIPSAFFLRLACVFYALQPLQTADWQIIKAMGRADLCVRLETIKKVIGLVLIVISAFISVEAVGISSVITAMMSVLINMIPAKKLVDYSVKEHFQDISKTVIAAVCMIVVVYAVDRAISSILLGLIVQVTCGIIVYLAVSKLIKNTALDGVIDILIKLVKRGR